MTEPKPGDLRIWHVPNPPQKGLRVLVKTPDEAILLLDCLAAYDNYLGDDVVFANAQGLEIYEDGKWCEYINGNGDDIDFVRRQLDEAR